MTFEDSPAPIPGKTDLAVNLGGVAVIAILAAIGIAYLVDGLSRNMPARGPNPFETRTVEANVAGITLSVPVSWMRFPGQNTQRIAERLDLDLPVTLGGKSVAIGATLLPRARVRASAQLLDTVYLHRFASSEVTGVPGLIGKPLTGGEGFENETVWYDPLSPHPFVAKCAPPVTAPSDTACLRTRVLADGLALVLSFPVKLLPYWQQMDVALEPALSRLGALSTQ